VNDIEFITRDEALKILGIKKESLYTYASRGLIKKTKDPVKNTSLYLKTDVEKMKTRAGIRQGVQRVAPMLRYGEPVVQSWICDITSEGPRYRGHLATSLAREGRSFEFVVDLIWGGIPRTKDMPWNTREVSLPQHIHQVISLYDPQISPLNTFAAIALKLRTLNLTDDNDENMNSRSIGINLIQAFSGLAGYFGSKHEYEATVDQEFISKRLIRGFELAEHSKANIIEQAINSSLILCADHELSAPTFTARITASTGVDLFACIVSALMAQSGPMQVGGASDLEDLLENIINSPSGLVDTYFEIPCFDHPLYDQDPRAIEIMKYVELIASDNYTATFLLEFVSTIQHKSGRYPNIFGALVILAMSLGLKKGAAAFLHTLGRSAGWVAHTVEQRLTGTMLRPRAHYMA